MSKEEDDDVGPVSDIQIVNEPVYYEVTAYHSHLL